MAGTTSVSVRIVKNDLGKMPAKYASVTKPWVRRTGFKIEAAAKVKVPVLTGTARRSIHTVIGDDGNRATVGPSVQYGLYLEIGTRRMPARPYMRPAFEGVVPSAVDELKRDLKAVA